MTDVKGPYRVGAFFILMSAVFHVLAPIWGGFSGFAGMLVPVGLFYVVLAFGLYQGWRWLAYVAFLLMLFGTIAAISGIFSSAPIPSWWMMAIAAADVFAVFGLFAALWRERPVAEA